MCSDDDDVEDVIAVVVVVAVGAVVVEPCRLCGATVNANVPVITGVFKIKITMPSSLFRILHNTNRQVKTHSMG